MNLPDPSHPYVRIVRLVERYENVEGRAEASSLAERDRLLTEMHDATQSYLDEGRADEDQRAALDSLMLRVSSERRLVSLVISGESLVGEVTWQTGRNGFNNWLLGDAPDPPRNCTMNCWEAVMFMAYQANLIDKRRLQEEHKKGPWNLRKFLMPTAGTIFSYAPSEGDKEGAPDVPAGSIVFVGDQRGLPAHVVLSTGVRRPNNHHEMLSNWENPPDGESAVSARDTLERTTLEAVMENMDETEATFAPAPW